VVLADFKSVVPSVRPGEVGSIPTPSAKIFNKLQLSVFMELVVNVVKLKQRLKMDTITLKSNKPMVIISLEEYEGMKETIELLTQNPDLPKALKEERKKIERGDYITFEEFKKKYKVKR
jgi:PHD/YefM family antitoxin component YafN of YafNO toxin-antitoxin module